MTAIGFPCPRQGDIAIADRHYDDTHPEADLPLPTVPGATHTRLASGLVTHEFAECELCQESLGVAGHDDADCTVCGHAACSSFGCGRCALLQDVDR